MEKWRKVGYFAERTVYARGNKRKLEIPDSPDVYFDLVTKKIWWNPNARNDRLVASGRDK